jgi:hypothetical protein
MRLMKFAARFAPICILMMCVLVAAEQNKFGVADTYQVSFAQNVRVADVVLPLGRYEIRHVMEGQEHIMVFRQLGTKKPAEVRAKCTLVALPDTAKNDQKVFVLNAANERVLRELVFKGDRAKHVF